jgi:hypothetical protein
MIPGSYKKAALAAGVTLGGIAFAFGMPLGWAIMTAVGTAVATPKAIDKLADIEAKKA